MSRLSISRTHAILYAIMKRGIPGYRLLLAAGALLAFLPMPARTDTVRDRASDYFGRIQWTKKYDYEQPAAIPGNTIPGGNESYASLTLTHNSSSPGIYPRMEGLGTLQYDGIHSGLITVLKELCESLARKEVPSSLLSNSRRFLTTITEYRLERIPDPDHVFFSRPEGESQDLKNSTVAVHAMTKRGERKVLFLHVETVFEKGLWKISNIIFDSGSYASITHTN